MVLYDKSEHYKSVYEMYNNDVKNFFKKVDPDVLFYSNLNDKDLWKKLAEWLRLPNCENIENVHAHKAKNEFRQQHLLKK